MRSTRQFSSTLALIVLAALAGCRGGSDADVLRGIRSGLQSTEQKARAEALIQLKSLLQKRPAQAEARMVLAEHLLANADPAGAKVEFQRALEAGAPAEQVLPKLARTMLISGQAAQVSTEYAAQPLADPKATAELKSIVAMAMLSQGQEREAAAVTEDALRIQPGHAGALLMQVRLAGAKGDISRAGALADELLQAHPRDVEALAIRGEIWLLQPGGRDQARQAFAKALEVDPNHVHALVRSTSLALAAGDLEGARKHQRQLRQAMPNLLITEQQEATIAYSAGDHARAREKFQGLLRAAPENVLLLLLAGQNEMQLAAVVQAEAMFSKALALQPRNDAARRLLAQAQLRLGQVPRALVTLAPLMDRQDSPPDVLALAAEAHLLNGDARAADALYARLAKLKPTDPKLRTTLATASLGREPDDWVFNELRSIAADDKGTTADMALVGAYLKRGMAAEALKALDAVDRKRPGDANQRILRGQILASQNDLPGARQAFGDAAAVNPGNLKAVVALAALDLRENKPDAAKERIQALLKQQPANAKAMLALAELLASDRAQAAQRKKLLESAVKAEPADVEARTALVSFLLDSGDRNAALVAAQAAIAAWPQCVVLVDLLAWCQQRLGENSQALSTYGKIVTLAPRIPRGHLGATELHLRNGDLDNAGRSIERGLQAVPGNPEMLAQAVVLAMRKRQPEEARAIARGLQKSRPGEAVGWVLEGEIEGGQQHWAAAAAAYRKALDKSPPPGLLPKYLHVLTLDGRAAEARAFADARLKAQPNDLDLLFYLGDVAQRAGDLTKARQLYEALLQRKADHLLALNNLATVHLAQKQPGALPLARRAAQLAPQQAAVLDTLAQALAAEGSLGEAVDIQRQAVRQAPDRHEFRLSLAKLLIAHGDKAGARQELGRLAGLGQAYAKQPEVGSLLDTLGRPIAGR